MEMIDYTNDPRAVLIHFNPNHDPKTGQFAKKSGGIRLGAKRYTNPDGSLNERGMARYESEIKKNRLKKKDNQVKRDDEETVLKDPNRWDREDTEEWKKISETGEKLVRSASDIEKLTRPKTKKFDLSNMTDAELRAQINRWQMEDTYSRLKSERSEEISKGRKTIQNILEYAGPTLALTSSALAIAVSIKKLKE
ncbi:MAG: hypothetical protein J6U54_09870 [Clostridiales bacterium]|nr:hypothetical protein [Clostridiales bacterium]